MSDFKVASTDSLEKLLDGLDGDDLKEAMIAGIKADGLSNKNYVYLQGVAKRATDMMLARDETGRDDAFVDAWNNYDWNAPIEDDHADGVPG